jgi:hypothetical protein
VLAATAPLEVSGTRPMKEQPRLWRKHVRRLGP